MHELSIANRVVEIASKLADNEGAESIASITLRIGALTCVHSQALEFSFKLVIQGTPLQGATLKIIEVPVVIHCANCDREIELPGIQRFRCPVCDTPSSDIRQGQELDIESIEVLQDATASK